MGRFQGELEEFGAEQPGIDYLDSTGVNPLKSAQSILDKPINENNQ
jgi:hypothetical protein